VTLDAFFQTNPRTALAFSGGVDSAYLLWAGVQAETEVQPYFVKTPFQPQFELEDARRLCGQAGVELVVLDYDILSDGTVAANPPDRCYHCKKRLFSLLKERAAFDGFSLLLDGTNASDDAGDRPGMRALRELSVRSPLRECGITKSQVRQLSREAGLFTWDKPAYACLATRVPTGQALEPQVLKQVEQAEEALSTLGFTDFRVRVFHGAARLQFPGGQVEEALRRREEVQKAVKPYFKPVLLDMPER